MTRPTNDPRPGRSRDEVLAALGAELSRGERWRYLGVLLASFTVTGVVATLWATEPSLPLRTHLSFAGLVALGCGWMGVAGYVLSRRRPLYASDRVLATGMAVVATVAVGVGATVLAAIRGNGLAVVAVVTLSATFVTIATARHVQARRRRAHLLARRRELEGVDRR